VAILLRSITAPLAAVVEESVIFVTGTNDGGAVTVTTHVAVCPPGALTVIVAVPGFLKSIVFVRDDDVAFAGAATLLLLLDHVSSPGSMIGNTIAVNEVDVAFSLFCTVICD
jgi:hypothetical protein